jgi:hypothetical protein
MGGTLGCAALAARSPTQPASAEVVAPVEPAVAGRRTSALDTWRPQVPLSHSGALALWLALLFSDPDTGARAVLVWFGLLWVPAALLLEACAATLRRAVPSPPVGGNSVRTVLAPLSLLALAALNRVVPFPALPALLGVCAALAIGLRFAAVLPANSAALIQRRVLVSGFCALLLPGLFLFQTTVIHDAFQYHATAVSLLFDRDFDIFKELFFYNSHRSYNPFAEGSIRYLGVPLLELPALVAGHVVAVGLGWLGWGFPPNGFSFPYTFCISVVSSAAGVAGVVLSFCWVARRSGRRFAFAAVALMLWASSLPMFLFLWHGWTHTYAVLGVVVFLLQRDRLLADASGAIGPWYLLGVIAGLLCLIWPVNGLILVIPAVDLLAALRSRQRWLAVLGKGVGLAAGAGLGFFPQLAGWYGATGFWVGSTYDKVGDFFRWTEPATLPLLFSWSQHGLLTWHPVLLPAFLGLVFVRDRRLALGGGLLLLLQLYVLSCWSVWWTGIGFGNRFFVNLFPLATLGLAQGMAWAWQRRGRLDGARRVALAGAAALLVFFNLSLLNAYRCDAIPMGIKGPNYVQDEPPVLAELLRTLFVEVPLTPATITRDFWVNQSFFAAHLRTALSGDDPGSWVSLGGAAAVLMACWGLVLLASLRSVASDPSGNGRKVRGAAEVPALISAGVLLVAAWLALAIEPSPPGFSFLRFDAGEAILRPGQKATFVPQGYLELTREVDVISFLTYAVFAPQGRVAARVRVFTDDGRTLEFPLVVGVDTAETSALRPEVRTLAAHSSARTTPVHEWVTRAYSRALYPAHAFLTRFALPETLRVERVEIEMRHGAGDLVLRDVFLRG